MRIDFPNIQAGASASGVMGMEAVAELRKALTAGYGSDVAALTGGGALRIQSLDKTMKATIAESKHFKLMNKLAKPNATATIDEWTEQSKVGGFLGGSTNTETGNISDATGEYARRVGAVKYLMTRRQVSLVVSLQNGITPAEAAEQRSGAIQLLQDAEYLSFEGDSRVVGTEFDGILATLEIYGLTDNIFNADAGPVHNVDMVSKAAAFISRRDNFGTPTDLFTSQLVQSDFDTYLDPAFRVALDNVRGGGLQIGAPVRGIRTSWGDIAAEHDVFIRDGDEKVPFEVNYSALAAANTFAPAAVAKAAASDSASMFTAPRAGTYYWGVSGVNKDGQSVVTKTTSQAVAAGEKVTLTITVSAAGTETGYVIYRSRKDGTNATADMREMVRIPRTGASTTYVDLNRDIPGTSKVYVLNMTPGDEAITWRQFLPMFRFPLATTNAAVIPWAQLLFGYLRLAKAKQHVVIKNVLPAGATWLPFG